MLDVLVLVNLHSRIEEQKTLQLSSDRFTSTTIMIASSICQCIWCWAFRFFCKVLMFAWNCKEAITHFYILCHQKQQKNRYSFYVQKTLSWNPTYTTTIHRMVQSTKKDKYTSTHITWIFEWSHAKPGRHPHTSNNHVVINSSYFYTCATHSPTQHSTSVHNVLHQYKQ